MRLATGSLLGAGSSLVIGGVSSFLQPRPRLSASSLERNQGRVISIRQQASPTRVIVGRQRVGFGTIVYADLTGSRNEFARIAGVICNHLIAELEGIYFDGVLVTEPASPVGINFIAPYTNLCFVEIAYGDDDQYAFPQLTSDTGGLWSGTTDRCRGHAGFYLRIEFDPTVFPNGLPVVEFLVKGLPTSGPDWSANGALVVNTYLSNARFGLGLAATKINQAALTAASTLSDEDVTITDFSVSPAGSTTEKRYEIHGTFETTETPGHILNLMMSALGGGGLPYIGGEFHILPAEYRAPALTLDEGDLIAPLSYTSRRSMREIANTVHGTFISPERGWKEVPFPEVIDATALALDGETLVLNISLPFTISPAAAQRLAWLALQKVRNQKPLSITTKLTGYAVQPGDGLALNFTALGWTGKAFEVQDATLTQLADANNQPVFGITHALLENPSTIYDDFTDYQEVPESDEPVPQSTTGTPFVDEAGCIAYIDENGEVVVIACPDEYLDVGLRFAADETQYFDPFLSPGFRVQDAGNRAVFHYSISDITDAGTIIPLVYSFDATSRYLAVLYYLPTTTKYLARLYYLGETTLQGTAISPSDEEYDLTATLEHGALSDVAASWTPELTNDSATGQWIDIFATKEGRLYVLEFTEEVDSEAVQHDYFRIRQITGSTVATRAKIEIPGNADGIWQGGGANDQAMLDPQLGAVTMNRDAAHAEGPLGTPDLLHFPLLTAVYHDTTETDLFQAAKAVRGGGKTLTASTVQMNDAVNQVQKMIRRQSGSYATLTSTNTRQDLNAVPRPAAAVFSTTLGNFFSDGFGEVRSFGVSGADFTVEDDSAEIITPQDVSPEVNELYHYIRVVTPANPSEGQTFTIGSIVYTFRATLSAAYDVKIGASASATNLNLYNAIGDTGTPGTDYGIGTVAHPDVEQVSQGGGILNFKSNGNSDVHIDVSTNATSATLTATRLPGGVGVNCWRQLPGDFLQGFLQIVTAFGVRAEVQP